MKTITFEQAKSMYVHRYTMEHIPNWARKPLANGKYYAPQYRSDREWFNSTLFPPNNPIARSKRDKSCFSTKPTWPLGMFLDAPYSRGGSNV